MDGLPAARKVGRSLQKVTWPPRKLMDTVKGLPTTRKIDGSSRKVSRPNRKFTEGLTVSWRVVRRSPGCTESCQKVFWPHEKLSEVDKRSPGRMESWRRSTAGLSATQKFTEVYIASAGPYINFRQLPNLILTVTLTLTPILTLTLTEN